MVHVHPEVAIEGVNGISQWTVAFRRDGSAGGCRNKNSRPFYDFRLIGMKNRDLVEGAIERFGPLT